MTTRIEDYGLIGDLRTAALVGKDGSIDWLCLPRFDSPACFTALLGDEENGRWKIAPKDADARVTRHYVDETLILETTFENNDGAATIIDFMPLGGVRDRPDLVRIVRGDRGSMQFESELTLRFDYGGFIPWVRRRDFGFTAVAGPNAVEVRTPVAMRGEDFRTKGEFTVREGDRVPFSMTWRPSHLKDGQAKEPERLLEETLGWWRGWSSRCRYKGPHRDRVMRSLIVLKALTYEPTGGMVASPTTSLPERLGGVRNWDYRYCWLRDATFTLFALLTSGYEEEAAAWQEWLLRSVAGRPSELQIMYGIGGDRLLPEFELDWLSGYEGSTPVRVGNAAHRQFQMDVFGEIMDCFHVGAQNGLTLNDDIRGLQQQIVAFLEDAWNRPDEGLWEVRGHRRHFTHSRLMAWVAVDRAVKAAERFGLEAPLEKWKALRERIRQDVCKHGFHEEKNAFVQYYGGDAIDAALLMVPMVGFLPPEDPRVQGTIAAVERELMHDGLVHRYTTSTGVDGLPSGEAAFVACSFWYADNLNMVGRRDEAEQMFDRLCGLANDLGLLSEEYDAAEKRMLGNFPQSFLTRGASQHGA